MTLSRQSDSRDEGRTSSSISPASGLSTPDLDNTITRMDEHIQTFASEGDPRERFLLMYRTFKGELRKSIQQGRFMDEAWSEAACVRMAETYFEAVQQYDAGDPACPECWVQSFDRSLEGETNFLQDALLGMNAHINYDLIIATYDTLRKFNDLRSKSSASGVDRSLNRRLKGRYHDYLMINQIAWESIPMIQDVLTDRFSILMGLLNRASFRVSKQFMGKIIMDYRDRSWGHVLLMSSISDPEQMQHLRTFLDLQAVKNIRRVMSAFSLNPAEVAQGAFRGFPTGEVDLQAEDYLAVSQMLMTKLREPSTAIYARRALLQYGTDAEPAALQWLQKDSTPDRMQKHLIRILGELGTQDGMRVLIKQLPHTTPDTTDLLCTELSNMAGETTLPPDTVEPVREYLVTELHSGVSYRQMLEALPEGTDVSLICQTAENRLARILLRSLSLLAVIARCPELAPDREQFFHLRAPGEIDDHSLRAAEVPEWSRVIWRATTQLCSGGTPDSQTASFLQWTDRCQSWDEQLSRWLRGEDAWLQRCALLAVFRHHWSEYAGPVLEACSRKPGLWHEFTGLKNAPPDRETVSDVITNWSERNYPMLSTAEKVLHLKKVELFNEIPAEDLTQIARLTEQEEFTQGEYLIRENTPGTALYILLEGTVEVVKGDTVITHLEAGSVVGEMSLLSEFPTTADCISTSKVRTLTIPREEFRQLLYGNHPEIPLGLLKVLTRRLEQTTRRAEEG